MIGQDLQAGPHDEQHEEHVEEVLQLQPPGKAGIDGRGGLRDAGMLLNESGNGGKLAQALRDGDEAEQPCYPDWQRPKRTYPAPADADARHDARLRRHPVVETHTIVSASQGGPKRLGHGRSRKCGHLAIAFWNCGTGPRTRPEGPFVPFRSLVPT